MQIISGVIIALTLLFLNGSALSQPEIGSKHDTKQLNCNPIGRVLNAGDRYFSPGSRLCARTWLYPKKGAVVKILCYRDGSTPEFGSSSVVSEKCTLPSPQQQAQRCTPSAKINCPKRKGPGQERNAPTMFVPYSSAILDLQPNFAWDAVAGATQYKIQLSGQDINWEKVVSGTTLAYPKERPALSYGNVYKATVIAYQNNLPVTYSSSVLIVSPISEAQQVKADVKQIQNLNLPPDEKAFDLNILFMGKNLLTEAINTLKARVEAGSQEPFIHRILGDRYLEAGLPGSAKQEYTKASRLAEKADDAAELAKAQEGLKRAKLYSQLPTKTNGDQ